ncbi:hypothetical protein ACA910_011698 [Epithemia clementina (nom. ined.)]
MLDQNNTLTTPACAAMDLAIRTLLPGLEEAKRTMLTAESLRAEITQMQLKKQALEIQIQQLQTKLSCRYELEEDAQINQHKNGSHGRNENKHDNNNKDQDHLFIKNLLLVDAVVKERGVDENTSMTGGTDCYNRGGVDCTGPCNKDVEEQAGDNAMHLATKDNEGLHDDNPGSGKTACNIFGEENNAASVMESEDSDESSNPEDDNIEYNLPEAHQEFSAPKNNMDAEEVAANQASEKRKLIIANRKNDNSVLHSVHDDDVENTNQTSILTPNTTPEKPNQEMNRKTGNFIPGNTKACLDDNCGVLEAVDHGKCKRNKNDCDILIMTQPFEITNDHGHEDEDEGGANIDKTSVHTKEPTGAESNVNNVPCCSIVNVAVAALHNTRETSDDMHQLGGPTGTNISTHGDDTADNDCDRPPLDKIQVQSGAATVRNYDADIDHAAENDKTKNHVDKNVSEPVNLISKERRATAEQEARKNNPQPAQMMKALSDEASDNTADFRDGDMDHSCPMEGDWDTVMTDVVSYEDKEGEEEQEEEGEQASQVWLSSQGSTTYDSIVDSQESAQIHCENQNSSSLWTKATLGTHDVNTMLQEEAADEEKEPEEAETGVGVVTIHAPAGPLDQNPNDDTEQRLTKSKNIIAVASTTTSDGQEPNLWNAGCSMTKGVLETGVIPAVQNLPPPTTSERNTATSFSSSSSSSQTASSLDFNHAKYSDASDDTTTVSTNREDCSTLRGSHRPSPHDSLVRGQKRSLVQGEEGNDTTNPRGNNSHKRRRGSWNPAWTPKKWRRMTRTNRLQSIFLPVVVNPSSSRASL